MPPAFTDFDLPMRADPTFPKRLINRVALITGGGSGIGKAISRRLASEGASVVILELRPEAGEETASQIRSAGGDARVIAADVSELDSVRSAFDQIERLDILVNNAGIAHVGTVLTTTTEDLDRLYAVNVRGVYHCLHFGVEKMIASGGGVILNMASIASKVGIPDRFAYSMSKGAVLTMTLSVARDFVDKKIRCNCICPARVHTPFVDGFLAKTYPGQEEEMFAKLASSQPIGRMGHPDEVASLATFLCSDEASFITGSAYDLDGGFTLLR